MRHVGPLSLSLWRSRETDFQAGRVFWRSRYDKRVPTNRQDARQLPWITGPTALDNALEALLTENAVSSWKISSEGRKTIVVLRLVTTTDPDMADFTHPHTATQHFRRKPPSQVRRDQRRAAERTRQNPEASEHSPFGLSLIHI